MNKEEELDLYRTRYHQVMALLESAHLIIDKFDDDQAELTLEEIDAWKFQVEKFGIGDKEPQQIHRKDYYNG